MGVPDRSDAGDAARELHERIGYARCELDGAREELAQLQRQQAELTQQRAVVESEVAKLHGELRARLGDWCALDDASQRIDRITEGMAKVDTIRRSFTYRATLGIVLVVNKVRRLVTFAWLRGK